MKDTAFTFFLLPNISCKSDRRHLIRDNQEQEMLDTMSVQDYEIILSDTAKYIARYLFTGIVIRDEASGEYIPYKKGRAVVTKGELKGAVYEGEFDGTALNSNCSVIRMSDGEWFEGSFIYNDIVNGTYYFTDGSYCTGWFKNFAPFDVEMYNKNGESEGKVQPAID